MQNNKKSWGVKSRDRVRGSIGIGLGEVNRVRNWDRVRAGGERVMRNIPPKKKKKEN